MNIRISTLLLAVIALSSCHSEKVTIQGKFVGLNANTVYLEQVSLTKQSIIDSVRLEKDGSYRFVIDKAARTPQLYNIVYNAERIPLLVSAGEHLDVGALGSVLKNYTVEGSEESELLTQFNKSYLSGAQQLGKTLEEYASAPDDGLRTELRTKYSNQYRELKRNQISFIVANKDHVAAVYALYQRLPGELYLSGADSDIIYYRTVADALQQRVPESAYLVSLSNDIARMEARNNLLQNVVETSYPDLEAKDMYGNSHRLSELAGNVILLDFWSAEIGNSNSMNADLKLTYQKYHEKGFEVYQVSVDIIRSVWVNAVQEQHLPWISVCDFRGERSPMLGLYNITHVPSNFLIDRNGTITAKNIYGSALNQKLEALLKQ